PSTLLGIASVYLLYIIGTRLYGRQAGLIAAGLFGTTVNHVVISRLGLQESYVIFFILLAIYFFLKAETHKKQYIGVGIAVGLGLLTKYTTGILIPIFLTYMLICRREDFKYRFLWVGTLISIIIFSPVIIYNFKLYQAVGHFDFQLSFIVGQNPEVWGVQPGKEEFPSLISRAAAFFPNLFNFNSWVFLALFAGSSVTFFVSLAKNIKETIRRHIFLLIILFWFALLIIGFIGPSFRFLAMLTPFMALATGILVVNVAEVRLPQFVQKSNFRNIITVLSLCLEILYSINSQLLPYPKATEIWAWSPVRFENYNWGYQELDEWMREKTEGKMPALAFEQKYHFVSAIHKEALAKAERNGKQPMSALFVYDKNINSIAQLWIMDRLQIYHAWPIITADTYIQFLNEKGADYFDRMGFQEIYYIFPTEKVPWKKPPHVTDTGGKLEEALTKNKLQPAIILENKRGEQAFRI
ncbi:MAG: glycosyltransferase family 39 protein, partial [Patescibacteria group bacterium]